MDSAEADALNQRQGLNFLGLLQLAFEHRPKATFLRDPPLTQGNRRRNWDPCEKSQEVYDIWFCRPRVTPRRRIRLPRTLPLRRLPHLRRLLLPLLRHPFRRSK